MNPSVILKFPTIMTNDAVVILLYVTEPLRSWPLRAILVQSQVTGKDLANYPSSDYWINIHPLPHPVIKCQLDHILNNYIRIWIWVWAFSGFPGGSVVKNPPAMQETVVWSLGWEDPLEKEMATQSRILAWRIPWTDEPGWLQSTWLQRVGHNWVTNIYIRQEVEWGCGGWEEK